MLGIPVPRESWRSYIEGFEALAVNLHNATLPWWDLWVQRHQLQHFLHRMFEPEQVQPFIVPVPTFEGSPTEFFREDILRIESEVEQMRQEEMKRRIARNVTVNLLVAVGWLGVLVALLQKFTFVDILSLFSCPSSESQARVVSVSQKHLNLKAIGVAAVLTSLFWIISLPLILTSRDTIGFWYLVPVFFGLWLVWRISVLRISVVRSFCLVSNLRSFVVVRREQRSSIIYELWDTFSTLE